MPLTSLSSKSYDQEDHWIPLSDLMTGLMMMFMLVAIVFMVQVEHDAKRAAEQARNAELQAKNAELQAKNAELQAKMIKQIALVYDEMKEALYRDLYSEFKNDLPVWHAVLSRDLSLRFEEPNVQFDTGLYLIKPGFIAILNNFFPRYANILNSQKYQDSIEEIRIEGHTSSIWKDASSNKAYFDNMRLSQDRTRAVLEHVLSLRQIANQGNWLREHLTANGLSSSKLLFFANGTEDIKASQRVEFRVKTKADDRLEEILRTVPR
jgi:outer membrane protein OmpA-like peptidoglycan-associated protein